MRERKHVAVILIILLAVITAPFPAQAQGVSEKDLLEVLQSEAELHKKARACQQLAAIGTKTAIPVLAGLLGDDKLGDYARYALEPMEDSSVDAVFRSALGKLEGRLLAGVVNSIGVRHDAGAVGALQELVRDPGKAVVEEALMALAVIGTDGALQTIRKALEHTSPKTRTAAADAGLRAAQMLAQRGRADVAASLYESISKADVAEHVRVSGVYGSIITRGATGVPLLVKSLRSNDGSMVSAALRAARELPSSDSVSRALAAELLGAKPDLQILLIKVIVDREDTGVQKEISGLVSSNDQGVRVESLRALGKIGGESAVGVLLKATDGKEEEAKAALASLRIIRGQLVDKTIIEGMNTAKAEQKTELISVLSDRHCAAAVPQLLKETSSTDQTVARASFKALAVLAGPKDLPALVQLLAGQQNESARGYAQSAVVAAASRVEDENKSADAVLKKLTEVKDVSSRAALIKALGQIANGKAYDTVVKAAGDDNKEIKDAAIRALAAWPDARAERQLLGTLQSTENDTHRTLALRGYVRILGMTAVEPGQLADKYAGVMKHVKRDAEMRLILGGLADVPHPASLDMVMECFEKGDVKAEASLAAVGIAEQLVGHYPQKLQAVMAKVIKECGDEGITRRARKVRHLIAGMKSYLVAWEICGPFTRVGKMYNQLFDIALGPEDPSSGEQKWVPIPAGTVKGKPWLLDVLAFYGGHQRVAYLRTRIFSPEARPARLELGSDDGVKVWLNSKFVHSNNAARAAIPGSDKADIELSKGWNTLMVKLSQNVLGWELVASIRDRDGEPIDGIKSAILPAGETVLPVQSAPAERTKAVPRTANPRTDKDFFNGKDLADWKGTEKYWKVEDGAIVGSSTERVPRNEFIWSSVPVKDFYLAVDVKIEPHGANAGIQFRSKKVDEHGQAHGYQADVGRGFWGKLYHEHGRGKLDWSNKGSKAVKHGNWNRYEILAVDDCIWMAINGTLSVSIKDPKGERSGHIALQIHSGNPQTVRYRIDKLIHDPEVKLASMTEQQLRAVLREPGALR
jgi:HEAT repeat protein